MPATEKKSTLLSNRRESISMAVFHTLATLGRAQNKAEKQERHDVMKRMAPSDLAAKPSLCSDGQAAVALSRKAVSVSMAWSPGFHG
jgi:hypothetical protein